MQKSSAACTNLPKKLAKLQSERNGRRSINNLSKNKMIHVYIVYNVYNIYIYTNVPSMLDQKCPSFQYIILHTCLSCGPSCLETSCLGLHGLPSSSGSMDMKNDETWCSTNPRKTAWWFFPTQLKNMLVKLDHETPWFRVKIKTV